MKGINGILVQNIASWMTLETVTILLVDDDAEFAGVVRHYLHSFQQRKFELAWVSDGEKAVEYLNTHPAVSLILMDYYLPGDNGLSIIKKFSQRQIEIPIILLTSNKDFRIAIEAMKYGIEEYLVKEEAVDTILPRTIVNVLDRVHLQKRILAAEKEKLISQKKTEAIQELVVTMCHEFNNPLAAIKISSDILSRQKITDEEKNLLQQLTTNISQLEKQIIKLRDLNIEKQQ
jgi:response regulator of citrate/malate metabolism